jgi:hypothetical protein
MCIIEPNGSRTHNSRPDPAFSKSHNQYLIDNEKELRNFYCTQYTMSDQEFNELFKLKQPAATVVEASLPSKEQTTRPSLF